MSSGTFSMLIHEPAEGVLSSPRYLVPVFLLANIGDEMHLDVETIEALHNQHPERILLAASTARRKAKLTASEPSKPLQH